MKPFLDALFILACLALAVAGLVSAGKTKSSPEIHYAPSENLEHIDAAELARAAKEIDFAAYVLTDWPVMQALTAAAGRGVKVRVYLDGGAPKFAGDMPPFRELEDTIGVEIHVKPKDEPLMHLKAYQIDGRLLRTGSANFSASGLKRQDNDLVLIESAAAARAFKAEFDTIFAQGDKFP